MWTDLFGQSLFWALLSAAVACVLLLVIISLFFFVCAVMLFESGNPDEPFHGPTYIDAHKGDTV